MVSKQWQCKAEIDKCKWTSVTHIVLVRRDKEGTDLSQGLARSKYE